MSRASAAAVVLLLGAGLVAAQPSAPAPRTYLLVTGVADADRTGRVCGDRPIAPDFPAPDPEAAAGKRLRTRGACA
ncbi:MULTISPECIES: hypothetical protein [Amycolatopsis]|uniref:Uncharacterized protein n=1 Tax=Amycolatopsis dendrobii TaxID=2760662 RepID=A0A7W3Z7R7_9PSEU|nr:MULTISPECIES: hypothetical protein [Amycolatopsis]MBB1151556.1 hypothetical protein [Amycolatopsis dendrobii]UKD58232.1 hypothetical protein L3Q65_16320 [Amycolatopsis sp. FU40]